jgi:hypothetical protein
MTVYVVSVVFKQILAGEQKGGYVLSCFFKPDGFQGSAHADDKRSAEDICGFYAGDH